MIAKGGFSLVEALIAAGLVGLAFISISTLFPTAYGNITYGGRTTTAVAYAQQQIEQLKAIAADISPGQGFNAINATSCSAAPVTLVDPLVPTITFTRTCTLTTNVGTAPLAGDLKKVRVTVTWAAQHRPGSAQMEALFTR
ncbi:MAG: type IV pilus modification PilV family protein [Candidatus Methylomirabilis sp.]